MSIASDELEQLRQKLKDTMGDGLSRQDTQRWSPHVTIQNKAPPETARNSFKLLDSEFTPHDGETLGLQIWEYLGGPWRLISRLRFAASE